MKLKVTSNLNGLTAKLQEVKEKVPLRGAEWAETSAHNMYVLYLGHLANQGRANGQLPSLSPATLKIYEIDGNPDGSGIRNHVEEGLFRDVHTVVGYVGVPNGKPTMIAKVQNDGCVIQVTEAMRGFLSSKYGINLRAETTSIYIPPRYSWDNAIIQAKVLSKKLANKILQF